MSWLYFIGRLLDRLLSHNGFRIIWIFLIVRFFIFYNMVGLETIHTPPVLRHITGTGWRLYRSKGICPVCRFHRLEHASTWGARGRWDLIPYFTNLNYTSELRTLYKGLKPQPVVKRLIDVEHTWACAWHYYYCVGVLGWAHLWEVDKWRTIQHAWRVVVEHWNFFISPVWDVWLWCVKRWAIRDLLAASIRLRLEMSFSDEEIFWIFMFSFWIAAACLVFLFSPPSEPWEYGGFGWLVNLIRSWLPYLIVGGVILFFHFFFS